MRQGSFPKSARILRAVDFERVRKNGKRFSTPSFNIHVLRDASASTRLGLAVSSKVGGAIVRNRVKRLLREFFRLNKNAFPCPADFLISVKNAVKINAYPDVEREMTFFLSKYKASGQQ